jgi:hypothetical protein
MPKEVGVMLANTLVSVAKVSFPISKIDLENSGEYQTLRANGIAKRIAGILKREPSSISLISTSNPKTF